MMYFGLVLILFLILSVSALSSKKQKGKDFSGKKSASSALVLGGIVGTIVGGSSTVGTTQAAFSYGFSALWYTLGCSIGILVFALVFSRRIYDSDKNTLLEIVSSRFGEKSGVTMSLLSAFGTTLSIVSQILSGTALLSSILPISPTFSLLVFILLVIVYVFFGGGISLGYMGILKTVLMALGFGFCGIVAYFSIVPSLSSFPSYYFNLFYGGVWKNLSQVISLALGIITGQNYSSALITGKTYKESRRAVILSAFIGPLIGLFCVMVGLYMNLNHPDTLSSSALPAFILLKMPPFLAGSLEGMLLLTLVGTTSGALYATSTIIYRGLLKNRFKNETALTRFLIIMILAAVSLVVMANKGDMILTWTFMGAGLRGAVSFFPLILALFYNKPMKKSCVLGSMIAAPVFTVLGTLLFPSLDILPVFWGVLGSLIFTVLGMAFVGKETIEPR